MEVIFLVEILISLVVLTLSLLGIVFIISMMAVMGYDIVDWVVNKFKGGRK